jgi:hypothetical protein
MVPENPRKVVKSLEFLLQGPGDPYVRFEKILAQGASHKLVGLGKVGAISLMHLWRPTEFACARSRSTAMHGGAPFLCLPYFTNPHSR